MGPPEDGYDGQVTVAVDGDTPRTRNTRITGLDRPPFPVELLDG